MSNETYGGLELCRRTGVITTFGAKIGPRDFAGEIVEMLETVPGISHTHSEKNGRIAAIVLEKGVTPRDITNQPHLALRILEGSIGDNWPRLLTPHDSN